MDIYTHNIGYVSVFSSKAISVQQKPFLMHKI